MADKLPIPESLKADLPKSNWGKVLAATPVIMTVIATLLAGLSSGEMVRAQYDRSLAAQQQSKAGDQWSYFQAKRLRAAQQRNTLDLLHAAGNVQPLDALTLAHALHGTASQADLDSAAGQKAADCLVHGTLPSAGAPSSEITPQIGAALLAVDEGQADSDVTVLLKSVKPSDLVVALNTAAARVRAYDTTLKPITSAIDAMEKGLALLPASAADIRRNYIAARLNCAALRYDTESRQNQLVAQLLELQVRQSNVSAERHHQRSQRFFYGMLLAQMAVIVSTFSLARQQRSFLWAFAATAGIAAVAFASYVYLFV